jgi:hypothetical protein
MQLGDPTAGEGAERSQLDVVLDAFDAALDGLINTVEAGGLAHLNAAEKISFWQRFEISRNRLPLVDHALIADAQASDLAGEYCFSNLKMLLTRRLQLSPSEAAARVRAAAAVGPRTSDLGEALNPVLPHLAAAQRAGEVGTEQVQIVARAMQKLTRPDMNAEQVAAAEQQLAEQAQLCGVKDLQLLATRVVAAVDPDGPGLVDEPLQQDRRHVELRQRRDGMWQLEGKLTNTVGAQLHAILDPLTRPRPTSIEIDGKPVEIPDETTGNGCTTGSKTSAAGCCSWLTGQRPVAPRPR